MKAKSKVLKIQFQDLDSFMNNGLSALKKGKPLVQPADEIVFSDVGSYEKFMTGKKLHILSAIKSLKPDSIYSLAKMVNRDFANVSRDCTALEQHGFICLEDAGDARSSKVPVLAFDYETILVQMPTNVSYSHTIAA